MRKLVTPTAKRVIEADSERVDQAYWLAYCQLGPEPEFRADRRTHVAYVRRLNETARQIFDRPN